MTNTLPRRKPYQAPAATPVRLAAAATKPPTRVPSEEERIDGHLISSLVQEFGSPLYLLSEPTLRQTARHFLGAFRAHYPRTMLAYSYKTNYLSAVCTIMRDEGSYAEVVSGFEYDIARDLGVPGPQIIFNGPVKTDEEIKRAAEDGARINLDGFAELERVAAYAAREQCELPVGIRINMKLNYPPWDKFGFNLESGEAFAACRRLARDPWLRLRGLHIHAGTFITDLSIYERAITNLIDLGLRAEAELGAEIETIDMGGGYASTNTLHTQLMRGETTSPVFEEYAEVIAGALARRASQFRSPPFLFLEPGRTVVDSCMSLVGTVVSTKTFASGMKGAILDTGVNALITAFWYQHDISLISAEERPIEECNILGGLCMNIDILRLKARLPALRIGDIVRIRNAGAYNISQSMQFIFPRPPVILLRDGERHIIRRRETGSDIRALERLPAHLNTDETARSVLFHDR